MAREPSEEIFAVVRFNAKKPHPPQALHVKYWCVGPVLIFMLTALPSKNAKISRYYYMVHIKPNIGELIFDHKAMT